MIQGFVLFVITYDVLSAQQQEASFKQRTLDSLSSNLISAKQQLSSVTKQQTFCLDEFLRSRTLITWVKKNLKSEHKLPPFSTVFQFNDPSLWALVRRSNACVLVQSRSSFVGGSMAMLLL